MSRKPSPTTGRQKTLAYAAVFCLGVFAFQRFIVGGVMHQARAVTSRIRLAERQVQDFAAIQRQKQKITESLQRIMPYVTSVEPRDKAPVILLQEIEQALRASGGSLISLSPSTTVGEEKGYSFFSATMRAEMSSAQLMIFLGKIQESPILLYVSQLSAVKKDAGSGLLRVEVVVNVAVCKPFEGSFTSEPVKQGARVR